MKKYTTKINCCAIIAVIKFSEVDIIMNNIRSKLSEAKRIVVKVGTSTLTYDNGNLNFTRLDKLARVLSDLANQGKDIILVSSGAIGVGVGKL